MTYPHPQNDDPFQAATDAQLKPREYFGQVQADAYFCVLEKGVGKVVFDPQTHAIEDRRTAIVLFLQPLPELNVTKEIKRELIAEFGEWPAVVWPSARALGLTDAKMLNGQWAKLVWQVYEYKQKDGTKQQTYTWKFLAFYKTEDECRQAFLASEAGKKANGTAGPAPSQASPEDKERETAYQFLRVIVQNAVRSTTDLTAAHAAVAAKINEFPPVAKFFNVMSTEVSVLLAEALAKAA